MEPQFRTSFVPKRPVTTASQKLPRRAPLGLLFVLTLIAFLTAVVLSIGVFLYEKYLGNSIARKGQALEAAQSSFEPSLIRELTRLGARLETAGTLLDQHTATTRLFAYLEDSTLASVQFRTFRFEILPDGNALLTMEGRARSFASVALQSDVFGKGNAIRSPVFDDLNVDPTGDVVFVMSATVDPQLVSYQGSAATDRPAPSEAVQEEIVTPTTTATTSGSGVPGTSTP